MAGFSIVASGESSAKAAQQALDEAAQRAEVSAPQIGFVVATGAGKKEVAFAKEQATEVLCAAKGIVLLDPKARGVIDLGGESTRVVKLDEAGKIVEYATNEKCASGTGVFLDAMAKMMGVPIPNLGPLSLESTVDLDVNSTCVVFAESEVVSLVHRQTPKKDILRGLHRAIAVRVHALINRAGLGTEGNLAIGGLAQNTGILYWLEKMMSCKLTVPKHPQIVSALGAAVIAAEKQKGAAP
jgi:benzoyl-CoA reductase subunit D